MESGRSHQESFIESSTHKFILFDEPSEATLPTFKEVMKRNNCRDIVRCCEPNYDAALFTSDGINVHEMLFKDGSNPGEELIDKWLQLLKDTYINNGKQKTTIGIHCIAGLGRTPVLVAIALIEDGMKPLQAVEFIRSKRRGAFNMPQINFLKKYKPSKKKSCIIM
ncbi:hypothetical protein CYY_001505 [Polysphondylium violaceum]|uniref:protein-tyrosine-phosphatase n=1 Tax=Polysphondylium violaceum TaxID=133409 RepID=A0A8J4Q358_9MYCE|nr:hypothetical protein CYY_001505 [Polysphondylium violaceum]